MGRDAGLVRLRVAGDGLPRKPGDALTVQVLGAVGLLSDTAPIRDLASFSDWYNCRYYGLILAAYLAFGAVYFAFFFEVFACGEVDCAAAGPALSSAPALPTAAMRLHMHRTHRPLTHSGAVIEIYTIGKHGDPQQQF